MATQPTLSSGGVETIAIVDRMEQAFLDYSMSVIVGRALPDVRDGLKPVQRRILYSMWESGLHPGPAHRKCAAAVGEVMKKYHPHGDTSIYDAMVRMAQSFSTREPLVDGHGNFGSVDGDPPAAMRYTEARLSPLSMELLAGIDEDTVDFVDNYDGYEQEPVVLPARFPNLLVNGASGIAVGMATNIPPHNLGEVIDACVHLVRHPDATLTQLMKRIPAPDFPTGARIIDGDGIRQACETGRGAITLEAVATTETRTGNLPRIVITEIPYQVNKATLLQRLADLVEQKKLDAVRDLRDESSRDGMRIVVELKRGEDPAAVLARVYKLTDLRTNFHVNVVALVDNAPRTLGLKAAIGHYLDHQRDVITRRTQYRLRKARDRAHLLEGLLTALDHLDEVIALIRASQTAGEAKQGLMERFELTEVQAQAVLDMRLRRLAALERAELEDEYQQLQNIIARLAVILADPAELDRVLLDELAELKRTHATPRRSVLVSDDISAEDVLAGGSQAGFVAREVTVMVTRGGYVKALARRRATPAHRRRRDPLVAVVRATTDDELLVVDIDGQGVRVPVGDVPVVTAAQPGTQLAGLTGGDGDGALAGAVALVEGTTVTTVSARGLVKRTEAGEFLDTRSARWQVAGVKDGDRIAAVLLCADDDDLVMAHTGGLVCRFPATEVRLMGRTAAGVIGMQVPDDEQLVSATRLAGGDDEDVAILTVGANGQSKRTPARDYTAKRRGTKGVQTGADHLVFCGVADVLHLATDPPSVVRAVELTDAARAAAPSGPNHPVAGHAVPETDVDQWRLDGA